MNHPTNDELLLLAYGELAETEIARVEAHLAECAACRAEFTQLDSAQVVLETALASPRRTRHRWIVGLFAAAAVLATVFLASSARPPKMHPGWLPTSTWSGTAGYVTSSALMDIDAQLTRLEQERQYGWPN